MNRALLNILRVMALISFTSVSMAVFAQSAGDINIHAYTTVAIPGQLLEPGDYRFRVDSDDPSTLNILSNNGNHLIGFFHVIPANRKTVGDSQIDLSAPDDAGISRIQAWYGTGESVGYEFTYSEKDLTKIDQLARANDLGPAAGQ